MIQQKTKSEDKDNKNVIAAIDIGTNSFHMVIAKINPDGMISIIASTKEMVRLGEGGDEMKYLSQEAMERGILAMKSFVEFTKVHNPKIRAIATSAVREAINGKEFIDLVKKETGIEVEIVSGTEEGRLVYLGISYSISIFENHSLIIDIGGGSTETVVGFRGNVIFSNSEKLGAIRLTRRFFHTEINL
jgi:exopolyphosphatase/guanosine-5'-triphosphate,3'-diphosphate pyrophosphatase